jgi:hypothetical protein
MAAGGGAVNGAVCRRGFLAALGGAAAQRARGQEPPARPITGGPKYHWFGYYDKLQFDPSGRYVLGMEVDFEGRSPTAKDAIRIGMIDLEDGDRWIELDRSTAWSWQQGCMLQWLPGSKSEVIFNDREGGEYVSRILDVRSGKKRTLPAPIYAVSPDATWAIAPDFRRLGDMRPGYGYNGIADPNRDIAAPENAGVWRLDLRTGKAKLIVPISEAVRIPNRGDTAGLKHWFNHLLVSPDGKRFIFLHRWNGKSPTGYPIATRMFTADPDGKNLHVVDDYGGVTHFIWRDPAHILSYAWRPPLGLRFYLYSERGAEVQVIGEGVLTRDGHCTYLPSKRWILADTYPDKERYQQPYVFEVATGRRLPLGRFHSPPEYTGEWRCDTHPRLSPDGKKVTIDTPHGGGGRQIWLIDISSVAA